MARITTADDIPSGPAVGDTRPSIWSAIHPRLLELIRAHRSTLIFVNSRRLAERLAGALNELAGETLVRSHHGSIARAQRIEIERSAEGGRFAALVATSSLELGIDMGAIDLVVQIEAPPSVASGLQRIGRGGHQVDAVSEGVIFPKFRGDLVACAAVAKAMHDGAVEATRYPRNPLDIVAQQIVAMASMDEWDVDELFATIRRAAPFAELSRTVFEGVLDMLSGRYPSDEFAELRPPRHLGSRRRHHGRARRRQARRHRQRRHDSRSRPVRRVPRRRRAGRGARRRARRRDGVREPRRRNVRARRLVVAHRGDHARPRARLAGARPAGQDAVLEGRPRRPAARARARHRPADARPAAAAARGAAVDRLTRDHDLDARAAENLLQYLRDQMAAARGARRRTIVVERVRDELGDWRVCVLSPRGGRIHAPWAMAAAAKIREETGVDVETLWGDDGFVVRFPDVDQPPDPRLLLPDPDEVQALVVRQLGATALFAAKFRENAARSLLLPKRRPGMRAPLWQQRKRAADLLAVASRYGSFPGAPRNLSRMPARLLRHAGARRHAGGRAQPQDSRRDRGLRDAVAVCGVAALQLRRQLSNDGDAPLAERRAQALAVDQAQLRELLGDAELRELLDAESMDAIERQLQRLDPKYRARSADGVHDMLLGIGDLTEDELLARVLNDRSRRQHPTRCAARRRILRIRVTGEPRYIAVEDAARYRDGLGVPLPVGIPESLLEPVRDPLGDLALRYARTHAPFTAADFAARYGLAREAAEAVLVRLVSENRLLEGEFRPGGTPRVDRRRRAPRMLRRRSLAKLRHEVEPVDQTVLGRFATTWQGIVKRRHGADALLDAIEQLQGAPLPASILETDIPAGADRRLRSGGSRCGDRRRVKCVGGRRAAWRSRRASRVVSRGSSDRTAASSRSPPGRSDPPWSDPLKGGP